MVSAADVISSRRTEFYVLFNEVILRPVSSSFYKSSFDATTLSLDYEYSSTYKRRSFPFAFAAFRTCLVDFFGLSSKSL